jgi:ketosteroid isomerase-like protein
MMRDPLELGFGLRGGMWDPPKALANVGAAAPQDARCCLESAVRDVLAKYTYYYDAKDISGLLTVFHENCELVNPRGTYVGHEAIRANYLFLMAQSKVGMHFATNILARVNEAGDRAWMTAYYYDISVLHDGTLAGTGGSYADVLVPVGGEWRIAQRRISYNFRHALNAEPPRSASAPPKPTRPETSRDLIGREWEM